MSVDVITLYLNPCVGTTLTQGGNTFKLVPITELKLLKEEFIPKILNGIQNHFH